MHTPKFPDKDSLFEIGGKMISVVPSDKRVRAFTEDSLIADSRRVLILIIPRKPVSYCFPQNQVDFAELEFSGEESDELGKFKRYRLKSERSSAKEAARLYIDSPNLGGRLNGYAILDTKIVQKWMEEDEVILVHPRDPYTRIDVLKSNTRVEFYIKGHRIVDADSTLKLFETGLPARIYVHPDNVSMEYLFPSDSKSFCPYKGQASYWDIKVEGKTYHDAAWSYLNPYDEVYRVKGYFSFYEDVLERIIVGESKS